MKKVFLAILTLLYIIACIGFTLHKPCYMNMPANSRPCNSTSKMCDKCVSRDIKEKDNGCCSNENHFVKNDNDQNIPESVFHPKQTERVVLYYPLFEISFNTFASTSDATFISHSQPPGGGTPIYVLNRVFRI